MKTIGGWCVLGSVFWFAFGDDRANDWPYQLGALVVGIVLYAVGHLTGEVADDD